MSGKPFIIKSKVVEPMLPVDSDLYDEVQESRIQIVQAINGYLAVSHAILFRLTCFTRALNSFGHFGTIRKTVQIMHYSP